MRHLLAALLLAAPLVACGGTELNDLGSQQTTEADLASCHGLKSAHCRCQAQGGDIFGSANSHPPDLSGQVMFTFVIPGKCYNQQLDLAESQAGGGCWADCRDAIGVDGHALAPGMDQAKADAGKLIHAAGACGGYMSAPYFFAAGTNRYRSDTAMGIGISIPGC